MLNKKDLINRTRTELNFKYRVVDIEEVLDATVKTIVDAVSNGEDVSIPELGKFFARFIKGKQISKTGIPWLKGKKFDIPDRFRLGFNPSNKANDQVGTIINKIVINKK